MSTASQADQVVDEILPEELEWTDLVRRYPKTCLALAAIGGYLLGRDRGPEILGALSGFAADRVSDSVNELLGEKVI